MKVEFKYRNGLEVKDLISGVKGIINCQSIWINGCIRYSIQPKAKKNDTSIPESWWLDEQQVEVIGEGLKIEEKETGGPTEKVSKQAQF